MINTGRAFKAEGTASAKALEWKRASCAWEIVARPVWHRVRGRDVIQKIMVQTIKSLHKNDLANSSGDGDTTQDSGSSGFLKKKGGNKMLCWQFGGKDGGALAKNESNRHTEKW